MVWGESRCRLSALVRSAYDKVLSHDAAQHYSRYSKGAGSIGLTRCDGRSKHNLHARKFKSCFKFQDTFLAYISAFCLNSAL